MSGVTFAKRVRRPYVLMMSEIDSNTDAPAGWMISLARSKAEIAAGQSVPLLPILDRLRDAAERLEDIDTNLADNTKQNSTG